MLLLRRSEWIACLYAECSFDFSLSRTWQSKWLVFDSAGADFLCIIHILLCLTLAHQKQRRIISAVQFWSNSWHCSCHRLQACSVRLFLSLLKPVHSSHLSVLEEFRVFHTWNLSDPDEFARFFSCTHLRKYSKRHLSCLCLQLKNWQKNWRRISKGGVKIVNAVCKIH